MYSFVYVYTFDEESLCERLAKVGLCAQEYLNHQRNIGLSGGEMKRFELASFLARHAQLYILDK